MHLPGIRSEYVQTGRLLHYTLFSGNNDDFPVIFLHGNISSSTFWEETMLGLPVGFRGIAPDLRGFGLTDPRGLICADRGISDWVNDIRALTDALSIDRFILAGHSMGGFIAWGCLAAFPERIAGVVLIAPGSPFGFGGNHGESGILNQSDGAGSGAGMVNKGFAERIAKKDKGTSDPLTSPRSVMNRLFWANSFKPTREDDFLNAVLSVHSGRHQYPGDTQKSTNWPGFAPGIWGPVNALSPLYNRDLARQVVDACMPYHILWVRGNDDQIVSDSSLSDAGNLGKTGIIPGWPGEKIFPSQPMISQTKKILEQLSASGAVVAEEVMIGCGHTPFIEQSVKFNRIFHKWLSIHPLRDHLIC
ncbi:MAG: alpha/beta hydrolase [Rhodothermaceae bacterium]|nr:alpha/beta hydrolase [Rhodothermaceae bacterium]